MNCKNIVKIVILSTLLFSISCNSNKEFLSIIEGSYSTYFNENIDCYDYKNVIRKKSYKKLRDCLMTKSNNSKVHLIEFLSYDNADFKHESLITLIYIDISLDRISYIDTYENEVKIYETDFLGFESEINTSKYMISKLAENNFKILDNQYEIYKDQISFPGKILFTSLNKKKVEYMGCFENFRVLY